MQIISHKLKLCHVKFVFFFNIEFLKHAPCMQKIEQQNEVCFKQYTNQMRQIAEKTPMNDISQEDLLTFKTTMKRKRDAADEGIKNVCW